MTTTELAHRPTTTVPAGEWALMERQATALAASDIIPAAYKRRPANVLVAAITGRHYGWDVLTAMRNGHVIEGSWGMKPEAMLGLVRQAGHSVRGEMSAEGASVTGTRVDTADSMTITFTLEDARRANLLGKGTWKQYPQMMCYWRAVGVLCRVLFSDLTAGVHTAEELGADLNEDGDVIEAGVIEHTPAEPMPLSDEAINKFTEACEQMDLYASVVLEAAFPDGVPDPLTDEHLPAMRDAYRAAVAVKSERHPETEEATDGQDVVVREQRPATRGQVGKIKGEYARLGQDDREAQLRSTADIVGRVIGSHNELGHDEAAALIERLVKSDATPEGVLFAMEADDG